MGPIGVPEMLFILAVALLIFGPKRLPELGRTIGKALGEFRRATTDLKRSIDVEMMSESVSPPTPARSAVPRQAGPKAVADGDADHPGAGSESTVDEARGDGSGDPARGAAGVEPADDRSERGAGATESGDEASPPLPRDRTADPHET